jgi:hypothetical protein
MEPQISEITRRDIVDHVFLENINLYGRFEEIEFLDRIWALDALPSQDSRFRTARGDIQQHTIHNDDWEVGWVFSDSRFNLFRGDDEVFLRFLCESIHPVVRSNTDECERLCQLYNSYLKNDGFQLIEKTRVSGKPIFVGKYVGFTVAPGIQSARETLLETDVTYVAQQITRMEAAVSQDPELAIGTAKELVETCCKSILVEAGVEFSKNDDLPKLVKRTVAVLQLTPDDIPDQAKAAETIKRLLNNLASITQGVAELRNHYGTGHGKIGINRGLQPRHAKLAVGAASTLAVFLAETHKSRSSK